MDNKKSLNRPPIVTIMGHVDHGKTTLLDYIRKTKVVAGEHGGITQHIGAYQIDDPKMTFIDTPGHAAFSSMRARGGKVADVVVLVIAANDGIKPQTEECFQHIKEAGVPFIVAINKIDLPDSDVLRVKSELSKAGYVPDDQGGEVVTVPISATQGTGVDQLLEMIALVAEMQNLKADFDNLEAIVIESELHKNKGPVATVLVRSGKLKVGDRIHAETVDGKVKALFNYMGVSVKEVGPADPVQILGFSEVPPVGAQVHLGLSNELLDLEVKQQSLSKVIDEHSLPVIVKADVAGSAEAIKYSLPEKLTLISESVGNISDKDILLAKTTSAIVVGFNVQLHKSVATLAEEEGVKVKVFNVIYELLDYLKDEQERLVNPLYGLKVVGKAEIIAEFKIRKDRIAGGKMLEGELKKDSEIRVLRENKLLKIVKVKSLKKEQSEVSSVVKGNEFGIVFSPYVDFKVGDIIVGL